MLLLTGLTDFLLLSQLNLLILLILLIIECHRVELAVHDVLLGTGRILFEFLVAVGGHPLLLLILLLEQVGRLVLRSPVLVRRRPLLRTCNDDLLC